MLDLAQQAQDDGDLDQALADIDTVLEVNPEDPDLNRDRGDILLDLGRTEDAADAYARAAEFFLVRIFRDVKQAVDACHRAKDLNPASPEPHRLLAKAHLMDGNADGAVIEYKSLWHSLLSHHRPKRAVEILREILNADCKFPRVKDQVIGHAEGSEAVKNSSAFRILLYTVALVVMVAALALGYMKWQEQRKDEKLREDFIAMQDRAQTVDQNRQYNELLQDIANMQAATGGNPKLRSDLKSLEKNVLESLEKISQATQDEFLQAMSQNDLERAKGLNTLLNNNGAFERSLVAKDNRLKNSVMLSKAFDEQIIGQPLTELKRRWDNDTNWSEIITDLKELASRKGLHPETAQKLSVLANQWETQLQSAEFLYRRAEGLETSGQQNEAMRIYGLAINGKGERFQELARTKLARIEVQIANNLHQQIKTAIGQNNRELLFERIGDLQALADSGNETAKQLLSEVRLPFTLRLDHHAVSVQVSNSSGATQTYHAPADTTGPWQFTFEYPIDETISVTSTRSGFSPATMSIHASDQRVEDHLLMQRGTYGVVPYKVAP